jgi:hypothetical protein
MSRHLFTLPAHRRPPEVVWHGELDGRETRPVCCVAPDGDVFASDHATDDEVRVLVQDLYGLTPQEMEDISEPTASAD